MAVQPDPIRKWREQYARPCLRVDFEPLPESGTSFTVHVTELRLKHAFMLLTAQDSSDIHICDIALRAGFSDISHFNPLFHSSFGDAPKGVRANQQTVRYAN
jgi:transcriptional regulator GlxA family with amidase domain